jgi:hypothetical protein
MTVLLEGQVHPCGVAYPVTTLRFAPGCCMLCGASPTRENGLRMFDTLLDEGVAGRRVYICDTHVAEWAQVMGGWSPAQVKVHQEQLNRLEDELHELREAKVELDLLRASVRRTLSEGAVTKGKRGPEHRDAQLRPVPGQRRPTL